MRWLLAAIPLSQHDSAEPAVLFVLKPRVIAASSL